MKLWCQVPFTKSKTMVQIEMYCMWCFLKSKYIKSRTFNDKNRWIIKKFMVLKKLLPHIATSGTYSPGDWRCDKAWREQTLVYPPVMCQQRLIYFPMRIERHDIWKSVNARKNIIKIIYNISNFKANYSLKLAISFVSLRRFTVLLQFSQVHIRYIFFGKPANGSRCICSV